MVHSFPSQLFSFTKRVLKRRLRENLTVLSFLSGLCFPFKQRLSHKRHRFRRTAFWRRKGAQAPSPAAQCGWTRGPATQLLFAHLQIPESGVSVRLCVLGGCCWNTAPLAAEASLPVYRVTEEPAAKCRGGERQAPRGVSAGRGGWPVEGLLVL